MIDAGYIIFDRLGELSYVTTYVGTGDDIRIYPHDQPPQNRTYPLICYRCSNDDRGDRLNAGRGELVSENISIASIARTYDEARALSAAVSIALDNQSGTWAGIEVQGCFKEGNDEIVESPPGSEEKFFVCESNFLIWYVTPES